eukprot:3728952-Rhodomonas_salina.3
MLAVLVPGAARGAAAAVRRDHVPGGGTTVPDQQGGWAVPNGNGPDMRPLFRNARRRTCGGEGRGQGSDDGVVCGDGREGGRSRGGVGSLV